MTKIILHIYDWLQRRPLIRWALLLSGTALMLLALTRLHFQEDISAFLPSDQSYQQALTAYRNLSGADRLIVIVEDRDSDADRMVAAVDTFRAQLQKQDRQHWTAAVTSQVDFEALQQGIRNYYDNLPLFLTDADYAHIDSVLAQPDYVAAQLQNAKQALMSPFGAMTADNLSRDPLGLFSTAQSRLSQAMPAQSYEVYDDHIFSADMHRAFLIMKTTFGASETEGNTQLLALLNHIAKQTERAVPGIHIHVTGAPAIAVSNASAIKTDSTVAIVVAVALILLLLIYALRNARNILLIVVSIGWGWLLAMAGLALIRSEVSIIVVGIASVIIGIAVNYPLHLIAHLSHTPDVRTTLAEIVEPLTVGNITTVGAFMALIPLHSQALRDLGIFASLLLLGTITFTLVFLPHLVSTKTQHATPRLLRRIGDIEPERRRWLVPAVAVITVVLAYFSLQAGFDSDMSHLNYMTAEQRADMADLQKHSSQSAQLMLLNSAKTLNEALEQSDKASSRFTVRSQRLTKPLRQQSTDIPTEQTQRLRLARWQRFVNEHAPALKRQLQAEGARQGFASDSFAPFLALLDRTYAAKVPEKLLVEIPLLNNGRIYQDPEGWHVVTPVSQEKATLLKAQGQTVIDPTELNTKVANTLNDDFNYIGWACSFIVFFFLWFSMGSIELAAISFLPMAVSWLWILGLMGLTGMQFNMVNVILATFIFGQGDDYTIFITEGCEYEYARGRRLLGSFKQSILISALIMFIGIGTLIFAHHPALRSLAQVTIIGMFSVVLMAWLLPPYIFRWMTTHRDGHPRLRPLTLRNILRPQLVPANGQARDYHSLVLDRYRYKGRDIMDAVRRNLREHNDYADIIDRPITEPRVVVEGERYGDFSLLLALVHRNVHIDAYCESEDYKSIAERAAVGVVDNLTFHLMNELLPNNNSSTKVLSLTSIFNF